MRPEIRAHWAERITAEAMRRRTHQLARAGIAWDAGGTGDLISARDCKAAAGRCSHDQLVQLDRVFLPWARHVWEHELSPAERQALIDFDQLKQRRRRPPPPFGAGGAARVTPPPFTSPGPGVSTELPTDPGYAQIRGTTQWVDDRRTPPFTPPMPPPWPASGA
jgi:hypothetical protein